MRDSRNLVSTPGQNTFAALKQTRLFHKLIDTVMRRPAHLPGLGCFYGPAGFGKTTAAASAVYEFRAVHVPLVSFSTKKSVMDQILTLLGIRAARTMPEMMEQLKAQLSFRPQPIIIDEADHLVERNAIEILRDIYETTRTPVILIGEEMFPRKLKRWERMHSRVLAWQPAEPATRDDVVTLASFYAPEIQLADDLQAHLLAVSHGAIRRIVVNLERIRSHCMAEGVKRIDLAAWGKRELYSGDAPARRLS